MAASACLRGKEEEQWPIKSADLLLSLLLEPVFPVITKVNPCSESSSQTLCCCISCSGEFRALLRHKMHLSKTRQGMYSVFYICIPPGSGCTAHCALQLCSPFPLSCDTALLLMHLWGRGHSGEAGGICIHQPRIRKTRTEG